MKKIIKFLNTLVITGSVVGSTMACVKHHESPNDKDFIKAKLNAIVYNGKSDFKINSKVKEKIHSLDDQIIKTIDEFINKPLTDYQIKYYDAQINGQELTICTCDDQKPGKFWFEIIANDTDPNWKGKTNRFSIDICKINLNEITDIGRSSDVSKILLLNFDAKKKYSNLDEQISRNHKFSPFSLKHYKMKYYDKQIGGKEITDSYQQKDEKIWVKIIADASDPNWEGETKRFEISFKPDLNTIENLQDSNGNELSFPCVEKHQYCYLNKEIVKADVFKDKPLYEEYKVRYYNGLYDCESINFSSLKLGKVWVEIIAGSDDPIWQGKTKRFVINICKLNLNIVNINNLILNFDADKKYYDLNKQIASAYDFRSLGLTKYKIKYYDAQINGQELTNSNQQKDKKIWFEIIADDSDSFCEGQTKRLQISSFKYNNLEKIKAFKDANGNELSFVVNPTATYISLGEQIIKKIHEFKDNPIKEYNLSYYDHIRSDEPPYLIKGSRYSFKLKETGDKQKPGKVWVEITANDSDPNWYSEIRFPITLFSESI